MRPVCAFAVVACCSGAGHPLRLPRPKSHEKRRLDCSTVDDSVWRHRRHLPCLGLVDAPAASTPACKKRQVAHRRTGLLLPHHADGLFCHRAGHCSDEK